MQLSIVTTLYRSAEHLREFVSRAGAAAQALAAEYEIILVNDASPDHSLSIAMELADVQGRIRVVDLVRNYGHYEAIMAGLRCAAGRRVFLIDCDLEEPPELLESLWAALDAPDVEMAVACQTSRRGGAVDFGGALYYAMLRSCARLAVPPNNLLARLMTRDYVDALVARKERVVSFDALCARAGTRYAMVPAVKALGSPTTYSVARRVMLFIDSMLVYAPLAVMLVIAVSIAAPLVVLQRMQAFVVRRLALGVGVLVVSGAAALVLRYCFLVAAALRHQPARVQRIYPDGR